jgi:hypothetical protein
MGPKARGSRFVFIVFVAEKFLLLKKVNIPVVIPRTGTFYKPLLTVNVEPTLIG